MSHKERVYLSWHGNCEILLHLNTKHDIVNDIMSSELSCVVTVM